MNAKSLATLANQLRQGALSDPFCPDDCDCSKQYASYATSSSPRKPNLRPHHAHIPSPQDAARRPVGSIDPHFTPPTRAKPELPEQSWHLVREGSLVETDDDARLELSFICVCFLSSALHRASDIRLKTVVPGYFSGGTASRAVHRMRDFVPRAFRSVVPLEERLFKA
ncbi:uncharacterized protein An13g01770 [Aspergillus niger]|uniref:Contig An13c0060, genomic contig n=2 Tax=Aspergillus niger TaxID=5061 RepID=A2R1M6_ASPNC|nr:uncharacterized protein An13g01770 [Aspergillus niger]CAK41576.1 unnamed protein product [Aspergillus niger]